MAFSRRLRVMLDTFRQVRLTAAWISASRSATPDERDLSVERYVADASGWARQLKDDPRFDHFYRAGNEVHRHQVLDLQLSAQRFPSARQEAVGLNTIWLQIPG